MKTTHLLLILSILFCTSCKDEAYVKQQAQKSIHQLEAQAFKDADISAHSALFDGYVEYINAYPTDSFTQLYKLRGLNRSIEQYMVPDIQRFAVLLDSTTTEKQVTEIAMFVHNIYRVGQKQDAANISGNLAKSKLDQNWRNSFLTTSEIVDASRVKIKRAITEYEQKVSPNAPVGKTALAWGNMMAYDVYADLFFKDTNSVEFLIKSAAYHDYFQNPLIKVAHYQQIIEQFPNHRKAGLAAFLKAFTLENQMKDIEAAKAAYSYFLQQYPKHKLSKAAQLSLDNIGLTADEILKKNRKR